MFQEIYDSFKDVKHIKYRYNTHNSRAKLFKKMLRSLSKGISNNNQRQEDTSLSQIICW